ncbi:DUF4340 domain-containing protein [bacterium]|nr:DUF4340 domain-containing protein [bacterium]
MNFKKSILFLIAFIVITIIVLVVEKPFKEPGSKSEKDIQKLFPGLALDQVAEIVINQIPEQTFTLQKSGDGWVVASENNFSANPNEVEELIKRTVDFDTRELVSRNPENQATFQVNKLGIEVQITDTSSKKIAHFFIGKNGPDYASTYVRADGSDHVYLQKGYLKSIFDKSRTKWRDARVVTFEKDNVDSLTLHFTKEEEGKKPVEHELTMNSALEGDKVVWNLVKPEEFPAKSNEVIRIVNALATFSADDFCIDKTLAETGLEKPSQWFTITMKDGVSHSLNVGSKENGKYYVKRSASDTIYLVNEYKINNLQKTFDNLKDEERKSASEEALKQTDLESDLDQAVNSITQEGDPSISK